MTIKQYSSRDFGRVAVLMGGLSAEREVSLDSGKNILNALLRRGVDAYKLDVGHDVIEKLLQQRPDRAFVALHGPGGEDGIIQAILESLRIPYTGSGVLASGLTMDKCLTKRVFQSFNIPTLPFCVVEQISQLENIIDQLGLPLCLKPSTNGSSFGVTKVTKPSQLHEAFELALQYDTKVLVEPWIEEGEYTVGILGNEALPVIEIQTPHGFYDYQAKYISDDTRYLCPSPLTSEQEKQLQQLALKAFNVTGCRHWGRVDAVGDKKGNFWLLEINTITGMTEHSLVPKAAKAIGLGFDDVVMKVLSLTL